MEIFVGKTVKIKSREWFNENEDTSHRVVLEGISFWASMADIYCSKIYKISKIDGTNIYLEGEPSYVFSKKLFDKEFDTQEYSKTKYKIGDKIKVKSIDWYNCNADLITGNIIYDDNTFMKAMRTYCSCYLTIKNIRHNNYEVIENGWQWSDEMLDASSLITSNNNNSNKYKVGDKVKVKSKEWYIANSLHNELGYVNCVDIFGKKLDFTKGMSWYCGKYLIIKRIGTDGRFIVHDSEYTWCDSMFEDETIYPSKDEISNSTRTSILPDEITIPKFNVGDVVTFTSTTTGRLYIYTVKNVDNKGLCTTNESPLIFHDYTLVKIGTLAKNQASYRFFKGDNVRFLNSIELENLHENNRKVITGQTRYMDKILTIEYVFYDLNDQIRYKIVDNEEIWQGWMLKSVDIINTSDKTTNETTNEINILPNNKTKLNIKVSSEVKIQLKPKKPIKYESCSSS